MFDAYLVFFAGYQGVVLQDVPIYRSLVDRYHPNSSHRHPQFCHLKVRSAATVQSFDFCRGLYSGEIYLLWPNFSDFVCHINQTFLQKISETKNHQISKQR